MNTLVVTLLDGTTQNKTYYNTMGNNRRILYAVANPVFTTANMAHSSALEPDSYGPPHLCLNTGTLEHLIAATSDTVCVTKFWSGIMICMPSMLQEGDHIHRRVRLWTKLYEFDRANNDFLNYLARMPLWVITLSMSKESNHLYAMVIFQLNELRNEIYGAQGDGRRASVPQSYAI